jgi:hypothetical protein
VQVERLLSLTGLPMCCHLILLHVLQGRMPATVPVVLMQIGLGSAADMAPRKHVSLHMPDEQLHDTHDMHGTMPRDSCVCACRRGTCRRQRCWRRRAGVRGAWRGMSWTPCLCLLSKCY